MISLFAFNADANFHRLLEKAILFDDLNTIQLLLDNGLNIEDKIDSDQNRPLFIAIRSERYATAKFLLEKGANINAINSSGHTILIELLIIASNQINHSYYQSNIETIQQRRNRWLEFLVQNKADLRTALHYVDDLDTATFLIEAGANVNDRTQEISTPLLQMIRKREEKIGMLLLERGAHTQILDSNNNTVLHLAVLSDLPQLVHSLIQVNPTLMLLSNPEGKLPIQLADSSSSVFQILRDAMPPDKIEKIIKDRAEQAAIAEDQALDDAKAPTSFQASNWKWASSQSVAKWKLAAEFAIALAHQSENDRQYKEAAKHFLDAAHRFECAHANVTSKSDFYIKKYKENLLLAAKNFEKTEDLTSAADYFVKGSDYENASRLYGALGNKHNQANMLKQLKGRELDVARIYEELHEFQAAAYYYKEVKDHELEVAYCLGQVAKGELQNHKKPKKRSRIDYNPTPYSIDALQSYTDVIKYLGLYLKNHADVSQDQIDNITTLLNAALTAFHNVDKKTRNESYSRPYQELCSLYEIIAQHHTHTASHQLLTLPEILASPANDLQYSALESLIKNFEKAANTYQTAKNTVEFARMTQQVAFLHELTALSLQESGNLGAALLQYTKAATSYQTAKSTVDSFRMCSQIATLSEQHALALEAQGDLAAARSQYEKAADHFLALEPKQYPDAARNYLKANLFDKALAVYIANNDHALAGQLLEKMEKYDEAAHHYSLAQLDAEVIRLIPKRLPFGTDCSICLEDFKNQEILSKITGCRHAFHQACLNGWIQAMLSPNCPLCKTPFNNSSDHSAEAIKTIQYRSTEAEPSQPEEIQPEGTSSSSR